MLTVCLSRLTRVSASHQAQEEVRVQRSRHSQLKVRLWQVSQKQRNLLNRLNRGLAGECCPLSVMGT